MNLEATHILLVREPDHSSGRKRTLSFFARNFLVKYDSVKIVDARSFGADNNLFWTIIEEGIRNNRQAITKLISELKESGFEKITDLGQVPRGYQSKTLHLIAHLIDGFFGVDSSFYNLEEDSHGLSEQLATMIREHPDEFRVVTTECFSKADRDPNLLDKLRKFEAGF